MIVRRVCSSNITCPSSNKFNRRNHSSSTCGSQAACSSGCHRRAAWDMRYPRRRRGSRRWATAHKATSACQAGDGLCRNSSRNTRPHRCYCNIHSPRNINNITRARCGYTLPCSTLRHRASGLPLMLRVLHMAVTAPRRHRLPRHRHRRTMARCQCH